MCMNGGTFCDIFNTGEVISLLKGGDQPKKFLGPIFEFLAYLETT